MANHLSERQATSNMAMESVTCGDRAFSVLGPGLWNNLPKNIRCSSNVSSFKTALKTHLFKQSFAV